MVMGTGNCRPASRISGLSNEQQARADIMGNWNQWSEETTERLKALWATGLSASRIACRITGTTRNAILGKVHRLNLERRAPSPGGRIPQTREERNAKSRAANAVKRLADKQLMNGHGPSLAPSRSLERAMRPRLWKTRHAPPVAPYAGEPVSILEVTGCKFAVGSEGRTHLFCNAPSDGRPWCEYHSEIVWGPL